MSRYIDIDNIEWDCNCSEYGKQTVMAVDDLHYLPTVDARPVVHGEWILNCISQKLLEDYDEDYYVECSLCHRTEDVPFELEEEKMLDYARRHFPFCHCGADMRGG